MNNFAWKILTMKIDMLFYHKNQWLNKKQSSEYFFWALKIDHVSGKFSWVFNLQESEMKYWKYW